MKSSVFIFRSSAKAVAPHWTHVSYHITRIAFVLQGAANATQGGMTERFGVVPGFQK